MTPIRYLYLDDENANAVEPFMDAVMRRTPNLVIELQPPTDFDAQMQLFQGAPPDGILLDLRLDGDGSPVKYRATSLAQEFRTRATEKATGAPGNDWVEDCPIVLWSTDEKLRKSFNSDRTGHDLFDLRCVKDDIDNEKAALIGQQMISLVEGYRTLSGLLKQSASPSPLLRALGFVSGEDALFLDPRVEAVFERRPDSPPAHEYARFIMCHLLLHPGPLIDEELVAARLGIDREKSGDFEAVLPFLESEVAYQGIFASAWRRWWATSLEAWWKGLDNCPDDLQSLTASERVDFLKESLGLENLTPAEPLRVGKDSSRFWTLCRVTRRPLDPRDGYVLNVPASYPWQDRLYVSAFSALKGDHKRHQLELDPLERERFKRAYELHQKAREKREA